MNPEQSRKAIRFVHRCLLRLTNVKHARSQSFRVVNKLGLVAMLVTHTLAPASVHAQQSGVSTTSPTNEQLAALQLELTNAWNRVLGIVNKPVRAYARTPGMRVFTYSPGWFHEGAITPDFDTVDVRQSQELTYASKQYVTSDLNPGFVFLGRDLEFNAMTKLFYTNRTIPKHKLSEAEMAEINRLYRIIGRCHREIRDLLTPIEEAAASAMAESEADPGNLVDRIQSVPKQTRLLYGGIGIGVLVGLVFLLRMIKAKTG